MTDMERVVGTALIDIYEEAGMINTPDFAAVSFTHFGVGSTPETVGTVTGEITLDDGFSGTFSRHSMAGEETFYCTDQTTWRTPQYTQISHADMYGYVHNWLQLSMLDPSDPVYETELQPDGLLKAVANATRVGCEEYEFTAGFTSSTLLLENDEPREMDDVTLGKATIGDLTYYYIDIPIELSIPARHMMKHPGSGQLSPGFGSFDVTSPEDGQATVKLHAKFFEDGFKPEYQGYIVGANGEPQPIELSESDVDMNYILRAIKRFADDKCVTS